MSNQEVKLEQVKWRDKEQQLRHIRTVVFIGEQNVPEDMEWDEEDETCIHVLAYSEEEVIGTGRLLDNGQIGRMAVLQTHRQKGIGSKILKELLAIATSLNMNSVFLNAQVDAIEFYKKFAFKEEGGVFDDAGIPHKKMIKML